TTPQPLRADDGEHEHVRQREIDAALGRDLRPDGNDARGGREEEEEHAAEEREPPELREPPPREQRGEREQNEQHRARYSSCACDELLAVVYHERVRPD